MLLNTWSLPFGLQAFLKARGKGLIPISSKRFWLCLVDLAIFYTPFCDLCMYTCTDTRVKTSNSQRMSCSQSQMVYEFMISSCKLCLVGHQILHRFHHTENYPCGYQMILCYRSDLYPSIRWFRWTSRNTSRPCWRIIFAFARQQPRMDFTTVL